ncbi:hypothetical protein EGD00_11910 [Pectobacterium carotovorum subsp. carotovorum]|nr:hypothetical protein EGD00_11910 [Pectobacterium carotovorum subsp. carotovorum]
MCVGCSYSPQSLTCVISWGFVRLPPSRNANYLGYKTRLTSTGSPITALPVFYSSRLCYRTVINTLMQADNKVCFTTKRGSRL